MLFINHLIQIKGSYIETIMNRIVFLYVGGGEDKLITILVGTEKRRDAIFRNSSCVYI